MATRPVLLRLVLLVLGVAFFGLLCGAAIGGWFGGFVSGMVVTAAIAMPVVVIPSATGTVPQMMGAAAERDVARMLRRSARNGAVVFDGVAMRDWEADHLILSPSRVLLVETKWSAKPWDVVGDPSRRVSAAVEQVTAVARRAKPLLRAEAGLAVPIDRLVVLCGRPAQGQALTVEVDGCPVIFEREVRGWVQSWCDSLQHSYTAEFERSCERFADLLERRDKADGEQDGDPWIVRVGIVQPVGYAYEAFLAAVVSISVTAWLVGVLVPKVWGIVGTVAVLGAAGYLVLRQLRRHAAAIGWALGSALLIGFTLVVIVRDLA